MVWNGFGMGILWYGMVWLLYGLVSYDMVFYGYCMVLNGMVWYGYRYGYGNGHVYCIVWYGIV